MKREHQFFAAGMAAAALLIGAVGSSIAADREAREDGGVTEHAVMPLASGAISGQVSYGKAGVALYSEELIPAGKTMTTPGGTVVPTVLTYTDEQGNATHYIAARALEEVFDVGGGVSWNSTLNCVDFCPQTPVTNVVQVQPGEEAPENLPEGAATVTIGKGEDGMAAVNQQQVRKLLATPTAPEYGVTCGPFTEVDPAEVDFTCSRGYGMDHAYFESSMGVGQSFEWSPENGNYVTLTIQNVGEDDVITRVRRPHTIGAFRSGGEAFSDVSIPAGKTLTRAFYFSDSATELQDTLQLEVSAFGKDSPLDGVEKVYISESQYRQTEPLEQK